MKTVWQSVTAYASQSLGPHIMSFYICWGKLWRCITNFFDLYNLLYSIHHQNFELRCSSVVPNGLLPLNIPTKNVLTHSVSPILHNLSIAMLLDILTLPVLDNSTIMMLSLYIFLQPPLLHYSPGPKQSTGNFFLYDPNFFWHHVSHRQITGREKKHTIPQHQQTRNKV
jgi:hypothetical protein